MSLNDTPSGERAHIVFFGVRNAGKSSLVNALTNQTVSVVSDVAGTTTDPVRKAMELAPAGPVLIVDTPGIDDAGDVGDLRVQRAEAALNEADVAVLVVDATRSLTPFDEKLLAAFQTRRIPYVIAENKADLLAESGRAGAAESSLPSPRLVVTDSQAFGEVDALLPADVPLTSFSILMARYKGDLAAQLEAVRALESLTDEDTVLIAEGCTHHRTCEDIGTVKLPRLIRVISGADPQFAFTSGRDFPDDLSPYAAIVHCGGCTLNARDMASRLQRARAQQAPFTNYGMTIACAHNILPRALVPLE